MARKSSVISVLIQGDNRGLSSELDDSSSRLASFGKSAGVALAAVGAAVGVAAFAIGRSAVSAASDLEESINAVNVAYGEAAEAVLKLGSTSATAMGVSRNEFNAAAVRFSAFAERVVGGSGDIAGFISDISVRAADFASVFNIEVSEALQVFQSGLSGEAEPLKRFGINLLDSEVKAFALRSGLVAVGTEMTEQIKVQARYGLLMEATAKTAGDFANTSDGLANSQRILKSRIDDIMAALGAGLLPIVTSVVAAVADKMVPAFERFAEFFSKNEARITDFGKRVLGGIETAVGFVGDKFDEIRPKIGAAVDFIGTKADEFRTFFDERLRQPVENVGAAIGTFVDEARTKLGEFASAVPGAVKAFTDFIAEVRALADDPRALGERLGQALSDAFIRALEEIKSLSGELDSAFRDVIAGVDFFSIGTSAVTALIQFGLGFAVALARFEWLMPVLTTIKENLGTILLAAISIALAPAALTTRLASILSKIPFAGRLIQFVILSLQRMGTALKDGIGTVLGAFGQAFSVSLGRIGPGIISRFSTFLRGLPQALKTTADEVVLNVAIAFSRFGGAVGNAVGRLVVSFRSLMSTLFAPFRNFGNMLKDDLFNLGKNLIDALIRGIGSMGGALAKAVRNIGRSVFDTLSKLWKISSPSKVFMGIGEDAMQGLALGLSGSERMLRDLATGVGTTALPSIDVAGPRAGAAPIVINVSGAIDPEGTARTILRTLRDAERRTGERLAV